MERVSFSVAGAQAHTAVFLERRDRGPPWTPGDTLPPNPALCRGCPPPRWASNLALRVCIPRPALLLRRGARAAHRRC